MKVWLVQCLCPNRHAIVATAAECADAEAADALALELGVTVAELLVARAMNPWCGLCGAPERDWHFESAPLPFSNIEAAKSVLQLSEASQLITNMLFGSHGDKPPRKH